MVILLISLAVIGLWLFGFFVGRNNPNIAAVNNLIGAGKVVIDTTKNILKKS